MAKSRLPRIETQNLLEPPEGFQPPTSALQGARSVFWSYGGKFGGPGGIPTRTYWVQTSNARTTLPAQRRLSRFFKVICRATEQPNGIVKPADVSVTAGAKQPANTTGAVIMVNAKPLISLMALTDRTNPMLSIQYRLILIFSDAVGRLQEFFLGWRAADRAWICVTAWTLASRHDCGESSNQFGVF